jgi:hypothetical protein
MNGYLEHFRAERAFQSSGMKPFVFQSLKEILLSGKGPKLAFISWISKGSE